MLYQQTTTEILNVSIIGTSDSIVPSATTFLTTSTEYVRQSGYGRFPYATVFIVLVWILLVIFYGVAKWRQRERNQYIIPRVFVLCSPRTVQFHYELILRIGLPANDFNPDKHDIDITVLGATKNEVVPLTRLNTKTLLDEPLITSLSIVIYRLVEMPQLGALLLRHSGPYKSWIYAYDFTVIDLASNKEWYYTLNQYIGSLDRTMALEAPNSANGVQYPIDDVPLPSWTMEDICLLLFTVVNFIMLAVTLMPINCTYSSDLICVLLTAMFGGCALLFLDWLFYYYLRWNQDRHEYFNDYENCLPFTNELVLRIVIGLVALLFGTGSIYYTLSITDLNDSLVWLLVVSNCSILVLGFWTLARQIELGETIVAFGLKLRGISMIPVGMRFSDMMADIRTKSGSTSDDGHSTLSTGGVHQSSTLKQPRSSAKSFGFDPVTGKPSMSSQVTGKELRHSSTGATPNNQPSSHIIRPISTVPSKTLKSAKPIESSTAAQRLSSAAPEPSKSLKTSNHQTARSIGGSNVSQPKEDSVETPSGTRSYTSSDSGSIGRTAKREKSDSSLRKQKATK